MFLAKFKRFAFCRYSETIRLAFTAKWLGPKAAREISGAGEPGHLANSPALGYHSQLKTDFNLDFLKKYVKTKKVIFLWASNTNTEGFA